jgi:hypothetical protein
LRGIDVLAELIDLVATLWKADEQIRDSSIVGESEMDRHSRKWVSIICGTLIALLGIAGIIWAFLVG